MPHPEMLHTSLTKTLIDTLSYIDILGNSTSTLGHKDKLSENIKKETSQEGYIYLQYHTE